MMPFLREDFGNANSIHGWGSRAHDAVERARAQIAELVGAGDPTQIFFTSGASEANNWLVRSFATGLYSPFEHSSLLVPAATCGWRKWPNHGLTFQSLSEKYEVASLMAVNNEIGSIWDIREEEVSGEQLHIDATQIVGKLPFTVQGVDFASFSAHKLYGPKGVGALFCAEAPPTPMIQGGEQEFGFRAGTLNVPAIVGFGAAAEIARQEMDDSLGKTRELRELLLEELSRVSDWKVLGGVKTSPFILGVSFAGVEGETVVIEADHRGFAVSSGAACSSRSTEPSHVLEALGLSESELRGTVRISFGKGNSRDSTASLARTLAQTVEMLRTMTGDEKNAQRQVVD